VRQRKAGRNHLNNGELAEVFQEVNLFCIREEIRKAREICGNKSLFINIMRAVNGYDNQVRAACEAGINGIVSGAGIPMHLPELTEKYPDITIIPILSQAKHVGTLVKKWEKLYHRLPDVIVMEDPSRAG
jgi:nitronate monooxygenase